MKVRQFGEGKTPRHVAAESIARRHGRDHIAPMDWAEAGALLDALKRGGFTVRRAPVDDGHRAASEDRG